MKVQKDWPYAYHNLQESLRELIPHLQRNGLTEPHSLNKYIDPKITPAQLKDCIDTLTPSIQPMKESTALEPKVTGMLLERFIMDIEHFKHDIEKEIGVMGLDSAQNGSE